MRPHLLRALVLDLYARITEGGELADKALHRSLRAHPELHSRERRHVAESIFAMVRLVRRLDFLLDAGLREKKQPPLSQTSSPEVNRYRYAAVLATELELPITEAVGIAGVSPSFANVLEIVTKASVHWPPAGPIRLAIERSLPDWFATRLHTQYGSSADALAAALNARAPLTLRANALKTDREKLVQELAAEHVTGAPGKLSPWSVLLDGHANVFGLKAYKSGLFEVQDEGSQLIAIATGAKSGDHVVDSCAGGGGKTLALAAMLHNKGRIFACDVTEARLAELPDRARRAGVFLVDRLVAPADDSGETALQRVAGRADVVLVDAPCSGTGSWRRHADARWKLTEAEADAFPARQQAILERASKAVKVGGRLVYATCALLSTENEDVAAAFASVHPEFEAVVPTELPASAIDARGHLRVAPHTHGTDAFFAAAFKRVR